MKINDIKAKVYDELVVMEFHQTAIQQGQRRIAEYNAEIAKLENAKEDAKTKK